MRHRFLIAVAALAASACASVPMASKERDDAAKTFRPHAELTNLYVYRASEWGSGVKYPVIVDGRMVGELPGSTFLVTAVPPGKHRLVVTAETTKSLDFETLVGKNFYIKVTPAMGWFSANANLYAMEEPEAQEDIRGCKMIEGY